MTHQPAIASALQARAGSKPTFTNFHEFDPETELTLLELPSSDLMSWMLGGVDNLVVTMAKADLAAGDFSRLKDQVSN